MDDWARLDGSCFGAYKSGRVRRSARREGITHDRCHGRGSPSESHTLLSSLWVGYLVRMTWVTCSVKCCRGRPNLRARAPHGCRLHLKITVSEARTLLTLASLRSQSLPQASRRQFVETKLSDAHRLRPRQSTERQRAPFCPSLQPTTEA